MSVRQMRLVVTAPDYDEALRFYRDVLGLPEEAEYVSESGRVVIMDAGRATLEITDPRHAQFVDDVEVGRRVAGQYRVAFEVDDPTTATRRLAEAGATVIAEPTRTPWNPGRGTAAGLLALRVRRPAAEPPAASRPPGSAARSAQGRRRCWL